MRSVSGFINYITKAGDTWDLIAYEMCGNETVSSYLMLLNREYMGVVIFGEGITLTIPVFDTEETPETLPPWRLNNA